MSDKKNDNQSGEEVGESCKSIGPRCPICDAKGTDIKAVTPQHTLKAVHRREIDPNGQYHFCENPDCNVVYFDCIGGSIFTTDKLINRVTIKDEHPDTPLCYCFKVLKKDALKELATSGSTDVIAMIKEGMKKHGCQCEKLNPRGSCCLKDIEGWLASKGIDPKNQSKPASGCGSSSGENRQGGCGC
ncbi:MAG: hypothetical protein HQL69_13160 [Magnetococcales bacterium]|nr:hypothetical protein [Magnetococcales bacterium]